MTATAPCRHSRAKRILADASFSLLCLLVVTSGLHAQPAMPIARVLVIFENGHLLPANIEADRGVRQAIAASTRRVVDLYAEFLDAPRFQGEAHERSFAQYLKAKYADQPPQVVVVAGAGALGFMLRHGTGTFGQTPIVHIGATPQELGTLGALPPHVVGKTSVLDFVNTVEQALRWMPRASRLIVVTGSSDLDRAWEARFRNEAGRFEGRLQVEHMAGLRTADVLQRLRQVGPDTIVYTPGYYQDADGATDAPRVRIGQMAAASAAPVFTAFGIGSGTTGGYMIDFEEVGRYAGRTLVRLLDGASPADLATREGLPLSLRIDWRQFQRWGLDVGGIPPDAVVMFKQPDFLETYRIEVTAVAFVVLFQAALIGGLLFERRRRRRAEFSLQKQSHELAHAGRVAMTAELTGAIAHEINQPLAAILSNADAAALSLRSGKAPVNLLREIMADIHRDVHRASEVVGRLRTLFSKRVEVGQPIELNELMREIDAFLNVEARRRQMTIELEPAPEPLVITGTRVEIQQVIVNLILNAMDAMEKVGEQQRRVTVSVRAVPGGAVIEVRDRGCGIPPESLPRLFDSFFTTKVNGMGLGLSISRTLVQAHEGRLTAANADGGGAVFRVELPVKLARVPQSEEVT